MKKTGQKFRLCDTKSPIYGCNKMLGKKLDENYSRMLRVILNKYWKKHLTKLHLYSPLFRWFLWWEVKQVLLGTAGKAIVSYGRLHMTHQCWLTSKNLLSSALCRHWIPSIKNESRESMLSACLDDDDDSDSSSILMFNKFSLVRHQKQKQKQNRNTEFCYGLCLEKQHSKYELLTCTKIIIGTSKECATMSAMKEDFAMISIST